MKVEDKIELQSEAKESCSSYLFTDGKFLSIFLIMPKANAWR